MNITYLLGAGASANGVPVAKNLTKGFRDMNRSFNNVRFNQDGAEYDNLRNHLTKAIKVIHEITSHKNITVDEYAKNMFDLPHLAKLENIKAVLACFFYYQQITQVFDSRYEGLIRKICNKNDQIKSNVKVLTWNYDLQLEMAYADHFNITDNKQLILKFKPKELNEVWPIGKSFVDYLEVVRLNGIATNFKRGQTNELVTVDIYKRPMSPEQLWINNFRNYEKVINSTWVPNLSFAWEPNPTTEYALNRAFDIAKDTNILVVIGYSFPDFNNIIDAQIMEKFVNVKRIYLQVAPEDSSVIKGRLSDFSNYLNRKPEIIEKDNLFDFHVPIELNL